MRFTIRPGRPADAPLLPALEDSAGEAFLALPAYAWVDGHGNHSVEAHLARIEEGTHWVAVDADDAPVGFLVAQRMNQDLFIEELAVRLDLHGRGLGRALIEAATAFARAEGRAAVTLTTFRDVPWNAPLYAHLGFQLLEDRDLGALDAVLRAEAARGLDREQRCGMRLPL